LAVAFVSQDIPNRLGLSGAERVDQPGKARSDRDLAELARKGQQTVLC